MHSFTTSFFNLFLNKNFENDLCTFFGSDYSHAVPFKMYQIGFRAFKSPPILNALVWFPWV